MKTMKRIVCLVLSLLVLASMVTIMSSADYGTKEITAFVGDKIRWRDYFEVPAGFRVWNPNVYDIDGGKCATMLNDDVIKCNSFGRAIFNVGLGDPLGGGYVNTLIIDIAAKTGCTVVFKTGRGEFPNGRSATVRHFPDGKQIATTQCPTITDSDYKLNGWKIESTLYTNTIPLNWGGITYVNANWRPYDIALDPNGGYVANTYIPGVMGQKIGEMPTPTRSGYIFDGWYTGKNSGTRWTADTVFDYGSDIRLYAKWKQPDTQISSVYISGVSTPKVGNIISTLGITVTEGVTTEAGMYWSKKAANGQYYQTTDTAFQEGGEYRFFVTIKAKSGYTLASGLNVYINGFYAEAKKQTPVAYTVVCDFPALPKRVTLTLNPAGGMANTDSLTVSTDGTCGTLPIPVKDGYAFVGWYDASGKLINENMPVEKISDYALTAHWRKADPIPSGSGSVISVNAHDVTVAYKKSGRMKGDIEAEDNAEYDVTYENYNSNIIGIDRNGEIIARKSGSTDVTVTVTDAAGTVLTDTCRVTVKYLWWQWLIRIFLFGFLWY